MPDRIAMAMNRLPETETVFTELPITDFVMQIFDSVIS